MTPHLAMVIIITVCAGLLIFYSGKTDTAPYLDLFHKVDQGCDKRTKILSKRKFKRGFKRKTYYVMWSIYRHQNNGLLVELRYEDNKLMTISSEGGFRLQHEIVMEVATLGSHISELAMLNVSRSQYNSWFNKGVKYA